MPTPIIELADEVAAQLTSASGYAFERRNGPYLKRDDLKTAKWLVVAAGDEDEVKGRGVNKTTLTVDVAYQIELPESTDQYPDPVENRPWFDTQMATVENIKSYFRPDGTLRDESFLGFYFSTMRNSPIYQRELLIDYQIFTAVIRLEFVGEV